MIASGNRSPLNYPGYTYIFPSRVSLEGVGADTQTDRRLQDVFPLSFPHSLSSGACKCSRSSGKPVSSGKLAGVSFLKSSLLPPPPG